MNKNSKCTALHTVTSSNCIHFQKEKIYVTHFYSSGRSFGCEERSLTAQNTVTEAERGRRKEANCAAEAPKGSWCAPCCKHYYCCSGPGSFHRLHAALPNGVRRHLLQFPYKPSRCPPRPRG